MRAMIVALIGIVSSTVSSGAETLLGRNYIVVTSSATWPGDEVISERFEYLNRLSAAVNFNVHPHVDAQVGGSYRSDESTYMGVTYDLKDTIVQAGLRGFYQAVDRVRPYATVAIAYVDAEATATALDGSARVSNSAGEVGYGAGIGVEFEANDKWLLSADGDFSYIDSNDAWSIGVWAGRWCWKQIQIGMSWSYELQEEDVTGAFTFVYAFR